MCVALVVTALAAVAGSSASARFGTPSAPRLPRATAPEGAPIQIGIAYLAGAAEATASVSPNYDPSSAAAGARTQYQTLIDDLNAHGGLNGHQVEPVFYAQNALGSNTQGVEDQSVCVKFTQDNHVDAALLSNIYSPTLLTCLKKAGVVVFSGKPYLRDDEVVFNTFPNYVAPTNLNMTRLGRVYVDDLFKQGFFGKKPVIGLLIQDEPSAKRALKQSLEPALAKHKLKLTETAAIPPINNVDAVAAAQPLIRNAVLRFKSAGVDHVLIVTDSGPMNFFTNAAEAQQFHPRYGVNTLLALANITIVAPPAQLADAIGVGWDRSGDVPNPEANATAQDCDALMKANNQPTGAIAWQVCDHVWIFAKAVEAAGSLAPKAIAAALPDLGTIESATALRVDFAGGHRDGVAGIRSLKYSADCKCFVYTGRERKIKP